MRVGVVGGAGFVGGHVVDKLEKAGHDVVIVDSRPPQWHSTKMFAEADVLDGASLVRALGGVQVVMHLAAVSNTVLAVHDPVLCCKVNCLGTVNVLRTALAIGAERVMVAGSSLISALQTPVPPDEPVVEVEDPIDALGSYHPYVSSKVYAEMAARDFQVQYNLPVTVFRYGIQYGPRMTPGVVVHTFIERALQGKPLILHDGGQQWRQYVYVEDVAEAHVQAIDKWDESAGATLPLVGDRRVSIADIAKVVASLTGASMQDGPARLGIDTSMKFCDPEHAKKVIGWEAKTTLENGIAKTLEWYRRHQSSGVRRR